MASDYQKLHEAVIEQSESNNWEDAKEEKRFVELSRKEV